MPVPSAISVIAARVFSSERPASTTRAPRPASPRAVSLPMPELAPVTRNVRPLRSVMQAIVPALPAGVVRPRSDPAVSQATPGSRCAATGLRTGRVTFFATQAIIPSVDRSGSLR